MSIEMNNKIVALQIAVDQLTAKWAETQQVVSALTDTVERLTASEKAKDELHGARVRIGSAGTNRNQNAKASKASV